MNTKLIILLVVLIAIVALTDGAGGGKKTTHKKRRTRTKKKTTHPKRRTSRAKRRTSRAKRRTSRAKKTTKPVTPKPTGPKTAATTAPTKPTTRAQPTTTAKPRIAGGQNDIHAINFDGQAFEFQFDGAYYMMYQDQNQISVTEGLTKCNFGLPWATCGCAIHFHYKDTSLIIDTCGAGVTADTMKFFTYTTKFDKFAVVDCSAKSVTTANRFNDDWWTTKDNTVEVGKKFLCAFNREDNYYYLRTNDPDQSKNVYVYLTTNWQWSGGIIGAWIKASSSSFGQTVGVYGNNDGVVGNDHFTVQSVKANNQTVLKPVLTNIPAAAAFWRLRTVSPFKANLLTRRDCPFDDQMQINPSTQVCTKLVSKALQANIGNAVSLQDFLRPESTPMSQADAAAACNNAFAHLRVKLTPEQFNWQVQNCISDMVNTGDDVWLKLDVQLAEAQAVQNEADAPATTKATSPATTKATAPATTKATTTTQKPAPVLPPACSNTVTSCGSDPLFFYKTMLNTVVNVGTLLKKQSVVTKASANDCCNTCSADDYCTEFTYDCNNQQCQLYRPVQQSNLNYAQIIAILNAAPQASNNFVSGFLDPQGAIPADFFWLPADSEPTDEEYYY